MPDFLTTLAQRTLKTVPVIQPMIAPLFSPGLPVASAPVEEETWTTPNHAPKQAYTNPSSQSLRLYEIISQPAPMEDTTFTHQQPSNLPSTIQKQQDSVVQPAAKTPHPQPTAITEFPTHEISSIHTTPYKQEENFTDASTLPSQESPINEDNRETLIVEHSPNEHITLPTPFSDPIIDEQYVQKSPEMEISNDVYPNGYMNIPGNQPAREPHTDIYEGRGVTWRAPASTQNSSLARGRTPGDAPTLVPNISYERIQPLTYPDQDRATTSHSMADDVSMQHLHSKDANDSLPEQFELVQRPMMGIGQALQTTETFASSSPIAEPGRGVTWRAPGTTQDPSPATGRTPGDAPTRFGSVETHRHTQASAPLPNISNDKQPTNSQPEQFELVQRETSHSLQPTELRRSVTSHAPTPSEITSTTSEATVPSTTTAPTVHITIGRIDVRAITTPNPETRRAPGKTRSQLSLDDYLNGQSKGGR